MSNESLKDAIRQAVKDANLTGHDYGDVVMNVLRSHNAPEPVSVSLEEAVRALWNVEHDQGRGFGNYDAFKAKYPNDCKAHGAEYWEQARACAKAWGLKHVD